MTDSAVLNTVLGLVFLFYAFALLCSGLVEMIANWVSRPEIPRICLRASSRGPWSTC
jgi:hypothetical protein